MNPYLLEINSNPAIFTDVPVLNKVITKMMNETLDIVLNQNGYDVPSKNWDIIYHQNNNWLINIFNNILYLIFNIIFNINIIFII